MGSQNRPQHFPYFQNFHPCMQPLNCASVKRVEVAIGSAVAISEGNLVEKATFGTNKHKPLDIATSKRVDGRYFTT